MNDIAIIMCTWKRIHRLHITLDLLNKQTNNNFDFFIWNNNINEKDRLDEIVKNSNLNFNLTVHHNKINEGGIGRFMYAKEINNKYKKVIFIDDDQEFGENMVKVFNDNYKDKTIHSWYSFRTINSYWHRVKVKHLEKCNYCGTGGMIVDSEIFNNDKVFEIPLKYKFLEDLWLSYVAENEGWGLFGVDNDITIIVDNLDQCLPIPHLKVEFWNYLYKK